MFNPYIVLSGKTVRRVKAICDLSWCNHQLVLFNNRADPYESHGRSLREPTYLCDVQCAGGTNLVIVNLYETRLERAISREIFRTEIHILRRGRFNSHILIRDQSGH